MTHHTEDVLDRDALVGTAGHGDLAELHRLLLHETVDNPTAPTGLLAGVVDALRSASTDESASALSPRARTAIRLLQDSWLDAAWAVLRDNAVGVVEESFTEQTSAGSARKAWPIPLQTTIEAPRVYAWLPGFRDPRFGAPDDCYDVTDLVTPKVRLDELLVEPGRLVLAGTAELRHLPSSADDEMQVVLTHQSSGRCETFPATRRRRPDLVTGSRAGLTRRAWAGWVCDVDPSRLRAAGVWQAWLHLGREGVVWKARLGHPHGELARGGGATRSGLRRAVVRLPPGKPLDLRVTDSTARRLARRLRRLM